MEAATRALLLVSMEELLGDRLSQVVALSITDPGRDDLITVLREAAAERHWAPAFPVLASTTWQFAEDEGTSAAPVIGA
jgi:hypothetical protein